MMQSSIPINLMHELNQKEDTEQSEKEEVKKTEIDMMKTSIADLNKRYTNFL